MRFLFTLIGCCVVVVGYGQSVQQALHIQIAYEKPGQYIEKAVATIEAVNKVSASAVVEYQAGRAVTLLPGFEAHRGSAFIASIKAVEVGKEGDATLKLIAFPNPFDQSTTIQYHLPADGKVNLWVTDDQGKIVAQLMQGDYQAAGNHRLEWQPGSISSGIYIPIIEVNQQKVSNRVIKK